MILFSNYRRRILDRCRERSAAQYAKWKLRLDPIFAKISAEVPPAGTILDAGCGFGIMSNLLAKQSSRRQVIGIDSDAGKLRAAQRAAGTLPNVRYLPADLLAADYPEADCVLLIDVLHYWSAEKQSRIIAKCAACLRDGGLLIFREGMRANSIGFRSVRAAERAAQIVGHNPRGDGLHFQTRDFYLQEFARHKLELLSEPRGWGRGSNAVMIVRRPH